MRWSALVVAGFLAGGLTSVSTSEVAAAPKKKEAQAMGMITWQVQPADVVIFLDGKKVGTAKSAKPQKVKAGMHLIRLVWGKDEAEEPLQVPPNQSIEFQYVFEDSGKPQPAPAPDEP